MKLNQFNFTLPQKSIAKKLKKERDNCKLMVVHRKSGKIELRKLTDILEYFDEKDTFVFNNSKVFRSKLKANKEKTNAEITVHLQRELNSKLRMWDALVSPARKIRVGNKLFFGNNNELAAEVVDNTTSRGRTLKFFFEENEEKFKATLDKIGTLSIPEHILGREYNPKVDDIYFQTIYAKHEGSVAPPAAGLRFSERLIKLLEIKGINFAELTLNVSFATFRLVDVEDLSKHKMDAELYSIDKNCCNIVNNSKMNDRKICSVGITTLRALESSYNTSKLLIPKSNQWTSLFIHPPYNFKIADCLLTGFHLPKSILYVVASAFGGYELVKEAYKKALKNNFKFYCYGDLMLII